MAPYCAILRDYLSDSPVLRAMRVFGVSTWPMGCDTPSPFSERFPLGEHAKWRCDTPPHKAILARYHMRSKKGAIPPLRFHLKKVSRNMGGGVSLKAARLQSEFCTRFFSSHEFSYEKCSEILSEIFEPLFCGSGNIPGKFPPNFPLNFPNFPLNFPKKFTDELLQG